jgi:hypothetical protein
MCCIFTTFGAAKDVEMKNLIPSIAIVLLAVSCNNDPGINYMTPEKAIWYFSEVSEICAKDGGSLWGTDVCGPVMYVDRESRKIIASASDNEGLLKIKDGVFTGSYPKEKIIDVIATEYGGTMFAMVPIPSQEDEYRIKAQTFHALTHVMQKKKGIAPQPFNNRHMNDRIARMWLKLEWKALYQALSSEGKERDLAIRDALIFRGARHESYPAYTNDEIRFENYEGLATFTYTKFCTSNSDEQKQRLLDGINTYYQYRTYSQYFGFIQGALYSFLLEAKGFDFGSLNSDNTDLGSITATMYEISLPEIVRDVAGSIAINYDIDKIREEETARERRIKEAINKELDAFTERPVLFIELESPSFGFETEDPNSLDTLGTIYRSLRVSDNWGKLVVDQTGCLVSHNLKEVRVPAKGIKLSRNHISGEDWNLILTDNWEVVKNEQNYYLRKLIH